MSARRWLWTAMAVAGCGGGAQSADKPTPQPEAVEATEVIHTIEPGTIVGLRSAQPLPTAWVRYTPPMCEGCDPNAWYRPADAKEDDSGDFEHELVFRSRPIARDGATHQLVLWQLSDDPTLIHGALLAGHDGAWRPLWVRRPAYQDESDVDDGIDDELVTLPLLQISRFRWALLSSPHVAYGDGESDDPQTYFVTTRLIEIGDDGPREVWSGRGPRCYTEEILYPDVDVCRVEVLASTHAGVHDLRVTHDVEKRKTSVTYAFDGTTYRPAR